MYPPPSRILQTPIAGKQKQSGTWSRGGDTEVRIVVTYIEVLLGFLSQSQKILNLEGIYHHYGAAPFLVLRYIQAGCIFMPEM
jgi:hypothetical protein